jgi:hypothetical protein
MTEPSDESPEADRTEEDAGTAPLNRRAIDLEALLVALVLAPATYSRNRFFELYTDPAARRARRRASLVRSVVRDACSGQEGIGEFSVGFGEDAAQATVVVRSLGFRRTTMLEPLELALVRYALARHRGAPLSEGDPDRSRIEAALHRLTGAELPARSGPDPRSERASDFP